jgi:hypothetical protein
MAVKKKTASSTTVPRPSTRSLTGVKAVESSRTTGAVVKSRRKANTTDSTNTDPAVGMKGRRTTVKSKSTTGSPAMTAPTGKMAAKRSKAVRPAYRCRREQEVEGGAVTQSDDHAEITLHETAVETTDVTTEAQLAAGPKRRKPVAPRMPGRAAGSRSERVESPLGDQSDNANEEFQFERAVGPRFNRQPCHNNNDYNAPATVDRRSTTTSRRRSSSADWLGERSPATQFRRRADGSIDRRTTGRRMDEAGAYRQPSRRPSPPPAGRYEATYASPAAADAADQEQHQQQPSYNSRRPVTDRRRLGSPTTEGIDNDRRRVPSSRREMNEPKKTANYMTSVERRHVFHYDEPSTRSVKPSYCTADKQPFDRRRSSSASALNSRHDVWRPADHETRESRRFMRQPIEIPKFDGRGDLEMFIRRFLSVAAYSGWDEEETFFSIRSEHL